MKKRPVFSAILLLSALSFLSQNFTWVRGDNFSGAITGTYGVQGVPNSANNPGHRHGAGTWVDTQGNLWLFGGEGYSSSTPISWLNDLWKYNPSTDQWTWIRGSNGPNAVGNYGTQGVANSSNEPGAREFATCWTDSQGNFWMFGGDGYASTATFGRLGDLWKYNPSANQWTWMKGFNTINMNGVYGTMSVTASSNLPGSRYAPGRWADGSGNLWMFGGRGWPSTGTDLHMNDLWVYNIATNNWTWMGGTNLGAQNGAYGTQGVPSTTNIPGGVEFPASWFGNNGMFYLFGGRGYVGAGSPGYNNDLWRYNPTTGEWTWLKGPNLTNQYSQYGTQGVSSPSTIPGGRYTSASWKDASGNFWIFGGYGWATANLGPVNDLFKYDPGTNQFTFMKGSVNPIANGIYGTMGVPAPANMPGAREYNTYWRGLNGDFWLMGAEGMDISSTLVNNMNDLWKFGVPCSPDSVLASPGTNICTGTSASLTSFNQYPASVLWYSSPTSTQSIGTGSLFSTGILNAASGSSVYTFYSEANTCTTAPRASVSITVNALPSISISGNTIVCAGASASMQASGATSYSWSNGGNSALNVVSPTVNTTYTVICESIPGCTSNSTFAVNVSSAPLISVAGNTAVCIGSVTSFTASGAQTFTWAGGPNAASYSVIANANTTYSVSGTNTAGCNGAGSISVIVNALPVLTVSATRTFVCVNSGLNTTNLTATGAVNYTWSNSTTTSTTVVTPTAQPGGALSTNIYTVTGTDANGCTNTSTIVIKAAICEGIAENAAGTLSVKLFPNPSKGSFNLVFEKELSNVQLKIVDVLGQVIYTEEINGKQASINLQLAKGLYFVTLNRDGEKTATTRLIIE